MSSTASPWFIRSGKKVQGPFSVEQLKGLKERGRLTEAHELSQDRVKWVPAADAPPFRVATAPAGRGAAAAASGDGIAWFHAIGSEQVGPHSTEQLRQLIRSGTLSPQTLVWNDSIAWTAAENLPEFSGLAAAAAAAHLGSGGAVHIPPAPIVIAGLPGIPRTAESVAILSLFTLGYYLYIWYFATRRELTAAGARIPPAWQLLIPLWGVYWVWTWAAGIGQLSKGRVSGAVLFVTWLVQLLLFAPTAGIASAIWAGWVQGRMNAAFRSS